LKTRPALRKIERFTNTARSQNPAVSLQAMLLSLPLFRRRLSRWYDRSRRDLPWRTKPGRQSALDPYRVLVSETMLQQTQVATVIPYYNRFLERFPALADLAAAPQQEVLRLWQGLGYYSRARNLQAAAQRIVCDHGGNVPRDAESLLQLPGVGRYTAGAIASIAFGRREPILDGNVQRVLCRLDKIESDPHDRQVQKLLWNRALEILPKKRVGDFNSALMELGATVCTPRNPQCLLCPVREHCQAAAAGLQQSIPARKKSAPTPLFLRHIYCVHCNGHWLIEQRPANGRWAGMWQFVTVEAGRPSVLPFRTTRPKQIGKLSHALTHRRYNFDVFACRATGARLPTAGHSRSWTTLAAIGRFPLPRPHVKVVQMLAGLNFDATWRKG
jgi:A/G-specific adenine glycosylase